MKLDIIDKLYTGQILETVLATAVCWSGSLPDQCLDGESSASRDMFATGHPSDFSDSAAKKGSEGPYENI